MHAMSAKYEKYVGRVMVIIYQDRAGRLTQRRILIRSVSNGRLRAYDLTRRAPRLFDTSRILAADPAAGSA